MNWASQTSSPSSRNSTLASFQPSGPVNWWRSYRATSVRIAVVLR